MENADHDHSECLRELLEEIRKCKATLADLGEAFAGGARVCRTMAEVEPMRPARCRCGEFCLQGHDFCRTCLDRAAEVIS
jgi:hypothetical protein